MTQFTVSRRAVLGGAASALLVPAAAHATTPARHYGKLFKTPLQFRLARTFNCHTVQTAFASLLRATFEELSMTK